MSTPPNVLLIPESVELKVKERLIAHFTKFYGSNVEGHVNALLAFDSHRGRLTYLQNKIGPEFFSSEHSILISGYSVGSEMIVAKQMGFGEVHGVEVDPFYHEICQQRIGDIPGMHPEIYDGSTLPYGSEQFYVVASSHVIEHTTSPEIYLRESMRVLIPSGYLLLEFPHRYHPIELHSGLISFEWLPHRIRNMVLKILTSRFSPLDAKKKKGYRSILDTHLQQMSMKRVKGALEKQQIPFTLIDSREWRPGVIRCIIKKPAGKNTYQANPVHKVIKATVQGLIMNTYEHRKYVLAHNIDIKNGTGLEIGPLDKPLVIKKDGPIKYLDYMSRAELLVRHAGAVDPDTMVDIDYINSPTNTLSEAIPEKFDYVIACHVIEHIPNMIAWLNELHKILKDGGYLYLAIPDKRYTFDIARPVTSLSHFLNDYAQNIKTANFDHIFEHIYMKRNITAADVWNNRVADKINVKRFSAQEAYRTALREMEPGKYPDVHCHVFTGQDFLSIVNTLIEMNLISYTVHKFEDVTRPYNEFILILKKQVSEGEMPTGSQSG
jgi:2-polyprenyl-3-methyl-5-hydroxy-6-metoxy-1,4-benzoquinol methylase